jgi:ABC-type amino acid transport substrate-binding protein
MTSAIALRPVRHFRLAGSMPFSEIAAYRNLRYGFIEGAATIGSVTAALEPGSFELVTVSNFSQVHGALSDGTMDAFFYSGVAEVNFIGHSDVVASDFYPLTFMPVSLTTQDPALAPVISIVEKALSGSVLQYLAALYEQGHQEYLRYKLFTRLTEEELAFIRENPVIPYGAEFDNYPVSFFGKYSKEWAGISYDVLRAMEAFTGLEFEIVNNEYTTFSELYRMLLEGEIYMVSELIHSAERHGRFLWPENSFMMERSVLISKASMPNISINSVYAVSVGVRAGTAHAELFMKWYPDHHSFTMFETQEAAVNALRDGEVDMVMCSYSTLLHLTNYEELSDYKANIIFDNSFVHKSGHFMLHRR